MMIRGAEAGSVDNPFDLVFTFLLPTISFRREFMLTCEVSSVITRLSFDE